MEELESDEIVRLALPEGGIELGLIRCLQDEFRFATGKYSPFHSAHEGYALILEEMDELKKEVFRKQSNRVYPKLRKEAIQVATMAIRFIVDICDNRLEKT